MARYRCIKTLIFEDGEHSFINGRIYNGIPSRDEPNWICFKSESFDEHNMTLNQLPIFFKIIEPFKYGK